MVDSGISFKGQLLYYLVSKGEASGFTCRLPILRYGLPLGKQSEELTLRVQGFCWLCVCVSRRKRDKFIGDYGLVACAFSHIFAQRDWVLGSIQVTPGKTLKSTVP